MPRAGWRRLEFLLFWGSACGLASVSTAAERVLPQAGIKILEIDPLLPVNLVAGAATGDSIHLTASNPLDVAPLSIKVTENSTVQLPDVEAQAGAAWYPPDQAVMTTVHWEAYVAGELSGSGSLTRDGVPTSGEWDEWHDGEGAYPFGSNELTNDQRKLTFDLIGEAEAFNEGANTIQVKLWGSTYVFRNGWTPAEWRHKPIEKKHYEIVFTPGQQITVGVPFTVRKAPVFDEITRPHPATLTVDLLDRNETRAAFKGNAQEYEQPRVRILSGPGAIPPGGPAGIELIVATDTRTHAGSHPPRTIHVTPDFDPIEVEIYYRQWDLKKNRGREYHRFVQLRPTVLHCVQDGPIEELPPVPPVPPIGEVPGGTTTPMRGIKGQGGTIHPPGEAATPLEGSVRVRIVSLLHGNPTLEFDASADADGEWHCGECVESGDQVELRYTFRDIFGRHFADTIPLAVPDSLDLDAPEPLPIRQPLLVVVESEVAPEPGLTIDTRTLDLASAAFGVQRPVPGIAITDVLGAVSGVTDAAGAMEFDVPHGAVVQVAATDPLGRYLPLLMPVTPPLETHLVHHELTPGQWEDDRLVLWMTPSFSRGRLHLGSGRIDEEAGLLFSRIGAVSDIDPSTVTDAQWETLEGDVVRPATMLLWGATPRADLDYVPALFTLGPPDNGNSDPAYQAALQAIVAARGARLRVRISDALEHVLDVPIEGDVVTDVETLPRANTLRLRVTPNPFNPSTTLAFDLSERSHVRLTIFAAGGRHVTTLIDGRREAGAQRAVWNGRDDADQPLASGVYFAKLEVDGVAVTRKLVLTK